MASARRATRPIGPGDGMHFYVQRDGDPIAWFCYDCEAVTVERPGEDPRCFLCGAQPCANGKKNLALTKQRAGKAN